jgi:hypothetical protein
MKGIQVCLNKGPGVTAQSVTMAQNVAILNLRHSMQFGHYVQMLLAQIVAMYNVHIHNLRYFISLDTLC